MPPIGRHFLISKGSIPCLMRGNVFHHVAQRAVEKPTQSIQSVRRYRFPGFQTADGGTADIPLYLQGVGRGLLLFHCFPQWSIGNHEPSPLNT